MGKRKPRRKNRRPFKTIELKQSIWDLDEEISTVRLYKPKLGDIRDLDIHNLALDDILTIVERIGRDSEGGELADGWVDEVDIDDLDQITDVVGVFFGSGDPDGEPQPET